MRRINLMKFIGMHFVFKKRNKLQGAQHAFAVHFKSITYMSRPCGAWQSWNRVTIFDPRPDSTRIDRLTILLHHYDVLKTSCARNSLTPRSIFNIR
jgi:hypothetical protein